MLGCIHSHPGLHVACGLRLDTPEMEKRYYEALKYMIQCETLCSEMKYLSKSLASQFVN